MVRIPTRTVVWMFWLPAVASNASAAGACAQLENKKPEARLEYLRGHRAGLDRGCVLYAIRALGHDRYTAAIKTLIGYLDYRVPDGPNPIAHIHTGSAYPAHTALFEIGKAAVPQLTGAIADEGTSDLVRNNAADTVFAIYRENVPGGIAALVSAAHARSDPMASLRLMDQARRLAARCTVDIRSDCFGETVK